MQKYLIVIACVLVLSHAQVYVPGPCPIISPKHDFSMANFVGRWHEQYRYPNYLEGTGKCVTAQFDVNATTGAMTSTNIALGFKDLKETKSLASLTMSAAGVGEFASTKITQFSLTPSKYMVIDTDYTGYAVLYSCNNYVFFHFRFVWIYTRERFINPFNAHLITKANAVLDTNNIDRSNNTLLPTDQVFCPLIW